MIDRALDRVSNNGSSPPLLELDNVSAAYGTFRALFDVSFTVPERSVVALLGPNGSGKSTVARISSGLVPISAGSIRFDGKVIMHFEGNRLKRLPAWKVAKSGIAHAPEGRSVFSSLTVEENLMLIFREQLGRKHMGAALESAYSHFPRLAERRAQNAGTLSGGEQRMLSLAKVLANPPRLLIVDELSLGLAPIIVEEVFATLDRIRRSGTTLLVVEQHVERALELADRAVLLKQGRVLHEGPVDEMGDMIERLLPGTTA